MLESVASSDGADAGFVVAELSQRAGRLPCRRGRTSTTRTWARLADVTLTTEPPPRRRRPSWFPGRSTVAPPGDATTTGAEPTELRTWVLLVASVAAVAGWLSFTRLQSHHTADSLIPVLASLYEWTPFYWAQDRYGMLIPLLAVPVRHPLANLLTQSVLASFSSLLMPFLACRFLAGPRRWLYAGMVAGALLLTLSDGVAFSWLVVQPYGVGLGLSFLGLILLDRYERAPGAFRFVVGFTALALGSYVLSSALVLLAPLVVLRELGRHGVSTVSLRRSLRFGLNLLAALAVSSIVSSRSRFAGETDSSIDPPSRWPDAWGRLGASLINALGWWPIVATVAVAAGGLAAGLVRGRRAPADTWLPAFAAAVVYSLLVGMIAWVRLNAYDLRYLLPGVAMVAVGVGIVAVGWLDRRPVAGEAVVAALVLLAVAAVRFGFPSYDDVRRDLDARFGPYTAELEANGATHLTGDYWAVWPTVFHVNWSRHERGAAEDFWGLTYRSQASPDRWAELPQDELRIAVLRTDPQGLAFRAVLGYPAFVPVGSSERFDYVRPPEGFAFP